ncbi:ThuA domain-containing protein [Puia sp. P3]|uniref:ThuA domain-containing protein n=1 Tax=Puia sp. P3 TaxID=3423952 RepID=UPI003D674001
MIYIGVGHDPVLLADSNYATLLRDALLWAGLNSPPPIPMKKGKISYEQRYAQNRPITTSELSRHLTARGLTIENASGDSLKGTGQFQLMTTKSGHYYQVRYDWTAVRTDNEYTLHLFHYYEKPHEPGITNDYSKIEYRWWDFLHGHPWSSEDSILFAGLHSASLDMMNNLAAQTGATPSGPEPATARPPAPAHPRFRALAIYENGGHHLEYSKRARLWLDQLAADSNFTVDYSTHADTMTAALLANYQLIIQLDYVPYGWQPATMTAFRDYIEQGKGGWVGFHHATLLGEFDGFPIWPWFSDFMGGIRWKDYIGRFASATVRVEDHSHPVLNGIPDSFTVQKEEWYTYDKSPGPTSAYWPASTNRPIAPILP